MTVEHIRLLSGQKPRCGSLCRYELRSRHRTSAGDLPHVAAIVAICGTMHAQFNLKLLTPLSRVDWTLNRA